MAKVKITAGRVQDFVCPSGKLQAFLWDSDAPGFALRATAGAKAYIFQGRLDGKTIRITIGDINAWSIGQAREKARELQTIIDKGRDPRLLKQEAIAADTAKREGVQRQIEAQAEAEKYTLKNLLLAYCDYLKNNKRSSHKDVRSIVSLHVVEAWPNLARAPAAALTPEQVADMMRKLLDAGKGRTANKLRSYMRAAFQVAKDSRFDARIPVAFKDYRISINPAAETVPDSSKNKSGKNPLDQDMLVSYWGLIKEVEGFRGALLRLHLLTGGQRIAQLVRLCTADATSDAITIFDNKGRPGSEPRPHMLPLIPEAKKALDEAASGGVYMLSTDGGKTHVSASTLNKWAQDFVGDKIPGFTGKRIRSGVETLLSKHGIGKDVRGRLQSHGITGVQDVHYDGHDYIPEKRKALMVLYNALERKKAKVTPIRSTAA